MNNAKLPAPTPELLHDLYRGDIIMMSMRGLERIMVSCKKRMVELLRDRSGLGAVEFAFMAPVLVVLYMGAVEITVALSVDTRVSRAGNITLDLITQGATTSKAELDTMLDVATSIMAPHTADHIELRYTGIRVDSSGKPKVSWSWGNVVKKPYATNSTVDIPDGLKMPNSFYVRGEIFNPHEFISTFPFLGKQVGALNLNETYYMRPRLGAEIDCTDC